MNLNAMIYSTDPVFLMAQMYLYEAIVSRTQAGEFNTFSVKDVDRAFKDNTRFVRLKYRQDLTIKTPNQNMMTITPL